MTLAAQAAEKEGLAKDSKVQARLDLLKTQILAEAASEKYMKAHPVSETEVKAEYDTQVAAMPKEYKARHILVEKKETAESLIRDLQAGGDFAKLAKAESKDPGSAAKGGDLGWFSGQSMVKPFSDALATLEKGAITKTPGADAVRLARNPARRHAVARSPCVRRRKAAGGDAEPAKKAAGLPGRTPQDSEDSEDELNVKRIFCAIRPASPRAKSAVFFAGALLRDETANAMHRFATRPRGHSTSVALSSRPAHTAITRTPASTVFYDSILTFK